MDARLVLGLILLGVGLVGYFVGRRKSRGVSVSAKNHSVAVGGSVQGDVINRSSGGGSPGWERFLGVTSAIVGLLGFGITLWGLLA